ncbi:zinc-finger domain-containing protein [Gilbertella persicaria]|uniref:zinc-finger domain-containing protein n=1 Tax=Gilbertella persicaria TaxID=101096 RepID=UPI00221F3F5E|nr:zinc-finger domain-containing protein [Gilbertella persicaria]KAI8066949.1 zinc-finger domain-containing protein [Gilbertella persicaria]
MLRHSLRLRPSTARQTSLKSFSAAYSTSLRPTEKSVAPQVEQSANRATTWSETQRPKSEALAGPRFEQTDLTTQPNPMAAIDLIAEEPIRFVNKRIAHCDGGGGVLGHPKIYINLDKPGPHACSYCGIRFQKPEGHHH